MIEVVGSDPRRVLLDPMGKLLLLLVVVLFFITYEEMECVLI